MSSKDYPEVVIVAGSKNDRSKIDQSKMLEILNEIGISWTLSYISAHRNDSALTEFCQDAIVNGAKVFIGIAGMAAALPGAIASKTKFILPVIGVPLSASDGLLSGMDALMAILRLPPGVPVLVPGIDIPGLKNAALAAAQIIALADNTETIKKNLEKYIFQNTKKAEINIAYFTGMLRE